MRPTPPFARVPTAARLLPWAAILLAAALASGCANVYKVRVQSEQSEAMANKLRYYLQCAESSPLAADLCEEARFFLAADLQEVGMIQADTLEQSDLLVVYGFSIEARVEEIAHFRDQSPVLKTDIGRLGAPVRDYSPGIGTGAKEGFIVRGLGGPVENASFSEGEKELKVIAYHKSLNLKAWDAQSALARDETPDLEPIWQVQATIADASKTLLPILPYLANAAVGQISQPLSTDPAYLAYRTKLPKPDPYDLVVTPVGP